MNTKIILNEKTIRRFLSKFDITEGCWNWKDYKNKKGYGAFWYSGKLYKAHRFSYIFFIENINEGKQVLHVCDNPSCVNPKHLFLGTNKDNMDDKIRKGRLKYGISKGENNGRSKFKQSEINEIRKIFSSGLYSIYKLSKVYNIPYSTIYDIVKFNSWE